MNYKQWLVFCTLALAMNGYWLPAQNTMSLSRLWEMAEQNHPSLAGAQANIHKAELQQRYTNLEYLPEIQLQAQNSLASYQGASGVFFPLPGAFNVSGTGASGSSTAANLAASATLSWEFFQFGKQQKLKEASRTSLQQARAGFDISELRLKTGVSRSFIKLIYDQQMTRWARGNAGRFAQLSSLAASLAKAGVNPGADTLLVSSSLEQAKAMEKEWQGRLEDARLDLLRWTGKPVSALTDSAHFFAVEDGPSSEPAAVHPQLNWLQQQQAYDSLSLSLVRKKLLPKVSLLAGGLLRNTSAITRQDYFPGLYQNPAPSVAVGLGLTWNLDAFYKNGTEVNQSRAELEISRSRLKSAELQVEYAESSSRAKLQKQLDALRDADRAYESAIRAYELFASRYQNGLTGLPDLLQIQKVLQEAERMRIQSYYNYWLYATDQAEAQADFSYLATQFK